MNEVTLHRVDELAFSLTRWDWPFARERRADIDAFWASETRDNSTLWNGRVLLLRSFAIDGATCRGTFFEADFADFAAWNKWGFPPPADAWNGFAMGALRANDGAFLLGVMGAHTINAGRIYFPAGTPDRNDIRGDTVDLWGSVMREVAEETGVRPDDYRAADWTIGVAGARVACIRVLDLPLPADMLRARILATIARDPQPEFSDIVIARGVGDLRPQMPNFVVEFLKSRWA